MKKPKYCDRLKELRESKGYTQREVARRLGIDRKSYQAIESGIYVGGYEYKYRELKSTHLIALAGLYGVSTDYILGKEGKR